MDLMVMIDPHGTTSRILQLTPGVVVDQPKNSVSSAGAGIIASFDGGEPPVMFRVGAGVVGRWTLSMYEVGDGLC